MNIGTIHKLIFTAIALATGFQLQANPAVTSAVKLNPTTVEVHFSNNTRMTVDFYGNTVFRLFCDPGGGIVRNPEANPEAQILVDNPRLPVDSLSIENKEQYVSIVTGKIEIRINKQTSLFEVVNRADNRVIIEETQPISFEPHKVTMALRAADNEYFYGGGVQNGRFSHKGKIIAIENQNNWTDGGVASPTPFYWSTAGYGMMWHTFKKGKYDFGSKDKNQVLLHHETNYLDVFMMVDNGAAALLNDFYQLTGHPVLLPKFGFYEGHLNAYNRDYWTPDSTGILFEDGKRYKESQKDNGGVKESLNGEKNNYQFSARAVIDRYKAHDMPLGWILPNDGYGAGYGQTETVDGNIANLKNLGDYARKNGVQIGLWTQSDLHPKPEISALLQRDIVKEVRDAGVRLLKTDVAWVGAGYSFGLNGIADVSQIMTYYGNNARPFIISLDGWAGTQRYAGIWTGDQTGGQWEYIRFHIPTYLGSGLSGQPNITSDMDGIFGGKNPVVNIRDFQWKAFTPMQLNMDGWGSNEKYPHALGEPAETINRRYLKLKSTLLPYTYSIAREAVTGLPMIRAMFLEYPNAYTCGKATQYQFLYGPSFLVAPIYQETAVDANGNDVRNGVYLPQGDWYDYFTGQKYEGNRILNSLDAPIDKLPVFVKAGAIIPMCNENNNLSEIDQHLRIYDVYPSAYSSFTEYDDDGTSEAYKTGAGATTLIESKIIKNRLTITVHPTQGDFEGFEKNKATEFRIHLTAKPRKITAKSNNKAIPKFQKTLSDKNNAGVYTLICRLPSANVSKHKQEITIDGFEFKFPTQHLSENPKLPTPASVQTENITAYTLKPAWKPVDDAEYYEIEFNEANYSTIRATELLFDGLHPETTYNFKIRAVNNDGVSPWTNFTATTASNPLEYAIPEITAHTTARSQGGSGVSKLVDFEENNLWHTAYRETAVPFDLILDLKTVNQLDKIEYLPRENAGNGTLLEGKIYRSNDRKTWTLVDTLAWNRDAQPKIHPFAQRPQARYLKISVTKAVGNFGSGRELYVFKQPETESYLQGDVNADHKLDHNDRISYLNYTGLRTGDSDFEGYISRGDINDNGLIDSYDISLLVTQLDGGAQPAPNDPPVDGTLRLSANKTACNAGETIELTVYGDNLVSVNALSFALPYNPQDYEFTAIKTLNTKSMENFTRDRLHTNGSQALYPTFVNIGNAETLDGSIPLFVIELKARKKTRFPDPGLQIKDAILVDKALNYKKQPDL
jgi:hypothetical protein